jgi:hypothetical protein
MLQTYNTWAHKRGYTLKLYSLTEVQQFSTAIFEAPDDAVSGETCSAPVMRKITWRIC